ncbi:ATP-dependent DNA helicase DinG [Acidovorax sp. 56]|uniref:ATP-dependent DNA helicase n=1 Tax=Acidovorax sp. 56 TaxID=2035205 RepID=UPI000C46AAF2|nr:ATP-dependent DNA helicase [Acidovorax sp. 56]PIF25790.1 ATP-dependent DNA helicase DinG [Acidovorax sp. 56]
MPQDSAAPLSSPSVLGAVVESVFVGDGLLARADPLYRPRAGQVQMALAVSGAIESGGALVVEAGTGVGKTYAYLVPVLLSGERALVSTATKALQDQLCSRDIPRLLEILGIPARIALLKGRSSYLCLHRMALARHDMAVQGGQMVRVLAKVEDWSRSTRSGDLSELTGLDERSPVIPLVTSTRDNCLGSQCPSAKECHVNLARREAMAADVVVVNHHLFFADVAVRESGVAELLPSVRVVIFDEAHQLSDTGVQFLGMQLTSGQIQEFARDVLAAGLQHARGFADWLGLHAALEEAARRWSAVAGADGTMPSRRGWWHGAPEGLDLPRWQAAMEGLEQVCAQAQNAVEAFSEVAPDMARLAERGAALLLRLSRFQGLCPEGYVRWLEAGGGLRLVESPLDIAEAMRTRLLATAQEAVDEDGWPAPARGPSRAWVFTSATLGHDAELSWFVKHCGLEGARILRVESPFDYSTQAGFFVPQDFPSPSVPQHGPSVAALAAQAAATLGGRTLILTTTLRALGVIASTLREQLAKHGALLEVLVQGEWPKRRLMERFRAGEAQGQKGCILIASMGFWEGFDVPGDALQLVVIDKLPFPPPGDPLVEARTQRIEAAGGRAFQTYALPEAAVALKQGAGRLIRRESDHGILVVCDPRLLTKGYGKRLVAVLPPMRRLETSESFQEALQALAEITRTSTKDLTWS